MNIGKQRADRIRCDHQTETQNKLQDERYCEGGTPIQGPTIRQKDRNLQCLSEEDGLDARPLDGEIAKIVSAFAVNCNSKFACDPAIVPVEEASVAEGANCSSYAERSTHSSQQRWDFWKRSPTYKKQSPTCSSLSPYSLGNVVGVLVINTILQNI